MKIAVIGLGGVGGYLCASFTKAGYDVVGFARGEHLKKIQKDGLTIIEDTRTWNQKLEVKTLEEIDSYFDVIIFCVKSYDLKESYNKISKYIDSKTILLSFSNGVNNGDILRELSNSIVLDGCIYILSHIEDVATIRKKGKVFAGVFGGDKESTLKLSQIFEDSSLRYKTPSDIKTALWKKYIFISAFATATSYYDESIGFVYKNHKETMKELLKEIANVAKAKGIDISQEIEKSLDTASKVPYDSSTSMHLDFQKGKKVELDSLSKYIVDEGEKYDISTPIMKKMYQKLQKKVIYEKR